jgi:cytoskeletal protein RodZ
MAKKPPAGWFRGKDGQLYLLPPHMGGPPDGTPPPQEPTQPQAGYLPAPGAAPHAQPQPTGAYVAAGPPGKPKGNGIPVWGWALIGVGGFLFLVLLVVAAATAPKDEEDVASEDTTTTEAEETTSTERETTTTAAPTTTTTAAPVTTAAPQADRMLTHDEVITGDNEAYGAYDVCQQFVEERLASPSSASYPNIAEDDGEVTIWLLANDDYRVNSHVDSDNAFGASLRSVFQCTVDYQGGDQWLLEDLELL